MSTGNGPSRERLEHDEALHDPTHRAVPVENLTPDDIREAVDAVRLTLTREERTAAVARIVRRRQRASVRVREEKAPYAVAPSG